MSQQHFSADGTSLPSSGIDRVGDRQPMVLMLLPLLAIILLVASADLIWRAFTTPYPTIASISPMKSANDFSVSPVSFTSTTSAKPMLVIVVTPSETPTPAPIGWQTATAEARLTATAMAGPRPCLDGMTPGTLCRQPTSTPIQAPTSTPIQPCDPEHWVPGELCLVGTPFGPTPIVTSSAGKGI